MKKKLLYRLGIILLYVGIFLWGVFSLPAGAVAFLVLFILVVYIDFSRKKKKQIEAPNDELNIQGLVEKYGEPDDMIIANPARGNEVDSTILVYRDKGFLIMSGLVVKKTEIKDVVLKNEEIPYLPADYQLHVTTDIKDYPCLFIPVGNALTWGKEVLLQLQQELSGDE